MLNQLAAELDIHTAMQNVRQVALELLDCERVTLFLIFERRKELRCVCRRGCTSATLRQEPTLPRDPNWLR